MRVDCAYYAVELLERLRKENARFTVSLPRSPAMWSALARIPDSAWIDALDMPTAQVAETTHTPGGWRHEPLRLIVRRVVFSAEQVRRLKGSRRLKTIHPEQLQMALDGQIDSVYGYSFILTDIHHQHTAWVEHYHRHRAQIEERIKDIKTGQALRHLPSGDINANRVWLTAAMLALNLTAWCCDLSPAAAASGAAPEKRTPLRRHAQTLRRILFNVPAGSSAPDDGSSCASPPATRTPTPSRRPSTRSTRSRPPDQGPTPLITHGRRVTPHPGRPKRPRGQANPPLPIGAITPTRPPATPKRARDTPSTINPNTPPSRANPRRVTHRSRSEADLKPHQVRSWLTSLDPQFDTKQADVCGLYLSPPENAIVVSLDEKTSIQTRQPIRKELPMQPGKPARRELEYKRHGVQALLAALLVHTGEVIGKVYDRNTRVEFVDFLDHLEHEIPAGKDVHAILDNLQVHKTPEVTQWLDEHPRWTFHFTPTHASWLNQIELFFSILTRRLLRRGIFTIQDDLRTQLLAFIEQYNPTAKPLAWTYQGKPLHA